MTKFTIKFARPQGDTIESYGEDFNHLLDQFIGGAEQWDIKKSHGQARLRQSNIQVQRYETGPEIIALLISTSPAILKSIAVLITAWGAFRKKEGRTVKITIGQNSFEGMVADKKQLNQIIKVLQSNQ